MSRATNDLDAVRDLLGPGIMYSANTATTFVMAVCLMCRIDWRLTLLALIPLPIVSLLMARMGARLFHHYEAIQASFAALTAKAQETLSGIRVVKAHVEEEGEHRSVPRAPRRLHREEPRHDPDHVGDVAVALAARRHRERRSCCGWAARRSCAGEITLGELVAFQIYLGMLLWPMVAFGWVTNLFQRGAASMGRIREIMDLTAESDVRRDGRRPRRARHAPLELRGVGFRYPGTERLVLRRRRPRRSARRSRSRSWGAPARGRRRCST